jgi:hypothetical protein
LKEFELTIPQHYLDYVNNQIKKPKRSNTEILELWLEHELGIENPGSYGNLPTDESHVTIIAHSNGVYRMRISNTCFTMIKSHVQPEPHSRQKLSNEDIMRCWLEIKIEEKEQTGNRIKVNEIL